jgi:hypothetical protein
VNEAPPAQQPVVDALENARGTIVLVKLKSGQVWEGIFGGWEAKASTLSLKLAQLQTSGALSREAYVEVMAISMKDLVSLTTKDNTIQTDTEISASKPAVGGPRQLQKWEPTGLVHIL